MEEFGFGLFDDLIEGEQHPLQIEDCEDEEDFKLKQRGTCIYLPVDGDSRLHRAIRGGKQIEINALLELYRDDFDKVRDYLVAKHQWDREDKIWFEKSILVANTGEQCRSAKSLEIEQIGHAELRRAVLVLLECPVDGEDVAVLHPSETNRSEATKLIKTLIPNGFLSWNFTRTYGTGQTFMEAAASKGLNHVIDRLYELGARIAIPGHNPLIQAIRTNKQSTVQWLLSKHFDHFDCTQRDSSQNNALIAAMQMNNSALFDLVLEKMIAYRQKYYNETEEEAFHDIFRLEHEEYEYTSIFTYIKKIGPILEKVENAVIKYKLNLSHRWKHYVVLGRLIERKIALDYCYEAIRSDPQLMSLKEYGDTTILQLLLRNGHYDFLREMYAKHPEVKSYFDSDEKFELLRRAFSDQTTQSRETIQFILEHHGDLIKSDLDMLKDKVVCCQYYSKEFYEARWKLFKECFPELGEQIEELRTRATTSKYYYGLEGSFAKVNINVSDVDKLPEPYTNIRGSNGETLLHWAVDKDDQGLFIRMLEAGCELDALDNDENHPVHLVKSEAMLDLIIDRHPEGRALIHRTNNDGCSVLHKVCQQRIDNKPLIALLEKVIDYGANVHQLTIHGESAVFFVGNCRMLDVLRKHDVQLDIVNEYGETPLERHLCNGNYCMSIPLFSYVHNRPSFKEHAHKYFPPMLNQSGHVYTYDYKELLQHYPEAARIMVDSVYEHSREEASCLFAKACGTGFVCAVNLFLDGNYKLDLNCKDYYESTPIVGLLNHMEQSNAEVVKRLLEKGADVHDKSEWGRDALMVLIWRYRTAKYYGHGLETVQLLLDHGASIQTTDGDGNTPLHLAFAEGEMELVEFLLQKGADPSVLNNQGKRPAQMASTINQELFYFYSQ